MELYKELLLRALENGKISIQFTGAQVNLNEIIESKCYQILNKIKQIILDDTLDDKECFEQIEKIVCLFEKNGISSGFRHDF